VSQRERSLKFLFNRMLCIFNQSSFVSLKKSLVKFLFLYVVW